MAEFLRTLAERHRSGNPVGITSVCSAHPQVLTAALALAEKEGGPVLIEATCNQVNQLGGYTGKTPDDFAREVKELASGFKGVAPNLILGGDHLGPNPWRKEKAADAMAKAEAMVDAYVRAGFTKIHLDASMACADDTAPLDDRTVASRAARLASVAENAAREIGTHPVYVLGTEVPVPGGADHPLDTVEPTSAAAANTTIEIHREVFATVGLSDAFERCIAFVVQPGVEFGNENVVEYQPELATDLIAVLDRHPRLVFEAHSTDYQSEASLAALVRDGFPILKVGPGLTFALREALFGLDMIATELDQNYSRDLTRAMNRLMMKQPSDWKGHYHGDSAELNLQIRYSYSDRIRYYWGLPEAAVAVQNLIETLRPHRLPETLISQYLSKVADRVRPTDNADAVVRAYVSETLEIYSRACAAGSPSRSS